MPSPQLQVESWTVKNVREGSPQFVPDSEPYFPVLLEVDGPWSLEPGEVLVLAQQMQRYREALERIKQQYDFAMPRPTNPTRDRVLAIVDEALAPYRETER